jgi:ABC-type multidrug transport system ATPase subunit
MEEAEKLSDQIVIMAFGEIKCIGNSLSLKTRFGAGYNLTLISNSPQFVKDLVARHVRAVLVSENGPSLMFNVPDVTMGDLIPLVREIEKNQLIRDWALSQYVL